MAELPTLVLETGRQRSLERRHPWVYSGAVRELKGSAEPGETVRVCSRDGKFLAWAAYSPSSQIRARVWSFDEAASIDDAFFEHRLRTALQLREQMLPAATQSTCRLVHAESDGLPGLIVDRYGSQLVLQATSAGAALHRHHLARTLADLTKLESVFERTEGEVLALEGLRESVGPLLGAAPEGPIVIEQHGLRFEVDVRAGHKTGFYLDQRDNRASLARWAAGRDVLDAFCYTGGFAIAAASAGARSVTGVDSSEPALETARRNAALNHVPEGAVAWERGDVFEWLRKARDRRASFDLVVLDPPKLARTARAAQRAARAYKDLNLLAFKLLRRGGLLFTFSCSAGVSVELLQQIVASAASDARVDAAFLERLSAAPDHPVALAFPEGEYLKGLLCRVS
jgi:23S rRNA (cytosine1962-C5)-methyltransferase